MKRRVLALFLLFALLLSGCASLLEREYTLEEPYSAVADDTGENSVLRVENYDELAAAVLRFVHEGQDMGIIRLYNYEGNVDDDISQACLAATQDDALGAYAVDYIKPTYARIVSYYELTLSVTYRRTRRQILTVEDLSGVVRLREAVSELLTRFDSEGVYRMPYLGKDTDYVEALVEEVYAQNPAAMLEMPACSVALYQGADGACVVEILLTWSQEASQLRSQYAAVTDEAGTLMETLTPQDGGTVSAQALFEGLRAHCQYDTEGGTTAYAALVDGVADARGMCLAYQTLCGLAGIECIPVEGYFANNPWYWCIVALDDGSYRHVDPCAAEFALRDDEQQVAAGMAWNRENYPVCGAAEEISQP